LSWFGKLKEPLERLGLENLFHSGSAEMKGMVKSPENTSIGDFIQNLKFKMEDSKISFKDGMLYQCVFEILFSTQEGLNSG